MAVFRVSSPCSWWVGVLSATAAAAALLRGTHRPSPAALLGVLIASGLGPFRYHQAETWRVAQIGLK